MTKPLEWEQPTHCPYAHYAPKHDETGCPVRKVNMACLSGRMLAVWECEEGHEFFVEVL